MNTELEGFTLVLMVLLAAVMLMAAVVRLARRHRLERIERSIDEEAAQGRAMERLQSTGPSAAPLA